MGQGSGASSRIHVIAVKGGIGAQGGEQDAGGEGRVQRDALQSAQFAQEFVVGGGRGRRIVPAILRRARGRSNEDARQGTAAAAQFARQFEGNGRAHAVAEESERAVEVRVDGRRQCLDQGAHADKGSFGEARFAAGQARRAKGDAGRLRRETCGCRRRHGGNRTGARPRPFRRPGNQAASGARWRRRRASSLRFSAERVAGFGRRSAGAAWRRSESRSKGSTESCACVLPRRRARSGRNLLVVRAVRQPGAGAPPPRDRYPAAAPRRSAPSGNPAWAGNARWVDRQQIRDAHHGLGDAAYVGWPTPARRAA